MAKNLKLTYPIIYAVIWLGGFCASLGSAYIKNEISLLREMEDIDYTIFFNTVIVYVIFMIEAAFNFLEMLNKYEAKFFKSNILLTNFCTIIFFSVTFGLILAFIFTKSIACMIVFMACVAILKFAILSFERNIERLFATCDLKTYTSTIS